MPNTPLQTTRREGSDDAPDGLVTPTVLIVEDEPTVRTLARRVLEQEGFSVLEAEDGVAGLETMTETPRIDLVLTDLTMPRLGGEAMAAQLADLRPEVPIVFMSGYSDSALFDPHADVAASRLLVKPFTIDELVAIVRRCLPPDA